MRNAECGIRNTEYGIRNTEYGIRNTEYALLWVFRVNCLILFYARAISNMLFVP